MKKNKKLLTNDDDGIKSDSNSSSNIKKSIAFELIQPAKFFTTKELCHYKHIDNYFKECHEKNPEILTYMIDIIEKKSQISLRILDWFVTKYSKKKPSSIAKSPDIFDVKISYKAQLKSYKKKYFDPFRRRKKFFYPCTNEGYNLENGNSKHIRTTLGQLNFFKWAFTNNIISYVKNNLNCIIIEMNNFNKEEKKKKIQLAEITEKKNIDENKKNDIKKFEVAKIKHKDAAQLTVTFD